jgi:hypothetical protein
LTKPSLAKPIKRAELAPATLGRFPLVSVALRVQVPEFDVIGVERLIQSAPVPAPDAAVRVVDPSAFAVDVTPPVPSVVVLHPLPLKTTVSA